MHGRLGNPSELERLAGELGLDFRRLGEFVPGPELYELLPVDAADRLNALPLQIEKGKLFVAIADPLDLAVEKKLRALVSLPVELVVADRTDIRAALNRSESSGRMLDNISGAFRLQIIREDEEGGEHVVNLDTIQDQAGVVLLANTILMAGLQKQASDVHIEAHHDRVDVKYRVDGVLYPATDALDASCHAGLVSRFKVIAELDIAERRIPQDGRFRLRIDGRDVDFRVSVLPTQHGEDVVIRILDKATVAQFGGRVSLAALGLADSDIAGLRASIRRPHGLVLVTGPTGSGKTTTLYGALSELADGSRKIITIEDPIEYELDGVVQIPVNVRKGVTFAAGLRSVLRHDPDCILIGEIRDTETAAIAVQAALTGHLVLASVHANSAIDVISRFTHWKLDLHDFVASLNTVVAQRLVRKLCVFCGESYQDGRPALNADCSNCRGNRYSGRIAVMEQLVLDSEISGLLLRRAPAIEILRAAVAAGMTSMRESALRLVRRGITSMEEIDRVIVADMPS